MLHSCQSTITRTPVTSISNVEDYFMMDESNTQTKCLLQIIGADSLSLLIIMNNRPKCSP